MRAALLSIPFLLSCGGSSAEKPAPPPAPEHRGLPRGDCAGPMAYKCNQASAGGDATAARRAEPEVEPEKNKVPDAVEAGPLVYKVVLDSDQVRVLLATYEPGSRVPMHRHPDHVVYALSGGNAAVFEKAGTHEVAVAGASATRAVIVELGDRPGSPVPAGAEPVKTSPKTHKLVLDADRIRVLDVSFKRGKSKPMAHGDQVLYSLGKGTLVFAPASGEPQTLELEVGKIEFVPAGVHTVTNPGKTPFDVVLFELKAR